MGSRLRSASRSSSATGCAAGEPLEGTTWRYELRDRSRENVGALVARPRGRRYGIHRSADAWPLPEREVHVGVDAARMLVGPAPLAARAAPEPAAVGRGRPDAVGGDRCAICVAGALPPPRCCSAWPSPPMRFRCDSRSGWATPRRTPRAASRSRCTAACAQIRYEAHLSHAILGRLDALFGRTDAVSGRAPCATLMHGATAWFVLSALAVARRRALVADRASATSASCCWRRRRSCISATASWDTCR